MFHPRKALPPLLIILNFFAISAAFAQEQDAPPAYTQYGHRVAYCVWNGGVLAWAPAIVMECALPEEGEEADLMALRDQAMAQCQDGLRKTPDEVQSEIDCAIGYNGDDFLDNRLLAIAEMGEEFPVTIRSKQEAGAPVQYATGFFQEQPWVYNEDQKVPFTVSRNGQMFCEGEYWMGFGLKIAATCDGVEYRGRTLARSILQENGMFYYGPKRVRVRAKGGAFIELTF